MRLLVAALAMACGSLLATACNDDDVVPGGDPADTTADDPAATGDEPEPDGGADPGPVPGPDPDSAEVVEVVGVTSAYEGVPDTVEPGTSFRFRNDSDTDLHMLAAVRIPDEEERSVEELMELPQHELDELFDGTESAFSLLANPGEEATEATGEARLTEPGRYALVCFIPVGTTAELDDDPPAAAPVPHALEGMYAEVTVDGA